MTVSSASPVPPISRQAVLDFLRSRSADRIAHLNGTLLEHLLGTEEILRSWGSPEELCRSGLCHAVYGTDGFDSSLHSWEDREGLASVIGTDAEEMVYFYASCDRGAVYPRLHEPGTGPVLFRDRFLRTSVEAAGDTLRDFVDLTLANELEIALHGRLAPGTAAWIGPFVDQMVHRASPPARRGAEALLAAAG